MKTILLVDDEPMVRRVMRLGLEKAGYAVRTAANGEEALAELRAQAPDALITDIEMPRMDGRALCWTIAQELPHRSFPIFVVTSLTEREHRDWSSVIDNLHFVEKPISMRKLLATLSDCLAARQIAATT
jgi:CheY-like chemotaxis protein